MDGVKWFLLFAVLTSGVEAHTPQAARSPFDAAVYAERQRPVIDDPKCEGPWVPRITPENYNGNGSFTCRDGVWVPDFAKVSAYDLAVARVEARFEATKWREVEVTVREGKQMLPFGYPKGQMVEVDCVRSDYSGLKREPGVTYILHSHSCGYDTGNGNGSLSWGANVPYTVTVRVPK